MNYFIVKRDSDLYAKIAAGKEMSKKWFESKDELFASVGLEPTKGIVMSHRQLYYPESIKGLDVESQFKKGKEMDCYVAKVNSPINKAWKSKCTELGLVFTRDSGHIIMDEFFTTPYALRTGLKTVITIDDDYYLEGEKELPKAEFLKPISEADYLEARLQVAKTAIA